MILVRPTCRNRFTSADFDFILAVLGDDPLQAESLTKLFHDRESLDLILDHERLFRALLEEESFLGVSSPFYFYVLVRRVMREAGSDDRELADYVAALLAAFSSTRRMRRPLGEAEGTADYLVDLLEAMKNADESTRFLLTLHLGNYTLFLAGIFPEYIEHRARRRAAPGLAYYEAMGSSHFNVAGSHRLAAQYELEPVLMNLADQFTSTRQALNDLSERLLLWGEGGLS